MTHSTSGKVKSLLPASALADAVRASGQPAFSLVAMYEKALCKPARASGERTFRVQDLHDDAAIEDISHRLATL